MKLLFTSVAAIAISVSCVIAGGPIEGCLKTHTVVAGDSCDGIAASFKLTPDKFYEMNPGLHHAGDHLCDNLDDGKKYCVCIEEPCVEEPVAAPKAADDNTSSPPAIKNTVSPDSNPGSPVVARSSPALVAAADTASPEKKTNMASLSSPFTFLVFSMIVLSAMV
ncbi:hypothetical protein [Absidia glauca]|uniref:LysM domain-containing protein n=1 Tax=Absidia glauca TaxID=4829 RepID=A0A163K665_ABSGL|nr:hypothetical protein [Absidia glauca]